MLAALVWLGFVLGLRHALEADHLATVGSLASGAGRPVDVLRVAGAWGLGHAAVLMIVGTAMVSVGATFGPRLTALLEVVAGLVLLGLGVSVLSRLLRPRRAGASSSSSSSSPLTPSLSRALAIGGLHGMEGSGSVVLIALPALRSPAHALAYLALFGAGSIAGMLACSILLAAPMKAARRLAWSGWALQLVVGATSVIVGGSMALRALLSPPY